MIARNPFTGMWKHSGTARDREHLEVAGVTLTCVGDPMTAGEARAISIRQHEVAISAAQPRFSKELRSPGIPKRNTGWPLFTAPDVESLRTKPWPSNG